MCTSNYSFTLPRIIILGVESLIIILANIVTVIVFWKRRSLLKQTCFFLINLTVADLMVGVGNIENVVNEIWKLTSSSCTTSWEKYVVLNEIFGCASISFLVLISLERLYAIVWPFRTRATSRGTYVCSIGAVWLLSAVIVVANLLKPAGDVVPWFSIAYMFVCLITISCAYCVIWFFYKKKDPRLPPNRHERDKELAKTLFIVTLLSLITWLPFTVTGTMRNTLKMPGVSGPVLIDVTRFLRLANSFINPIVYCFRIPLFRRTLTEMFLKKMTTGLNVGERQTSSQSETIAAVVLSISYLNVTTKTNHINHNNESVNSSL